MMKINVTLNSANYFSLIEKNNGVISLNHWHFPDYVS